MILDDKLVSYVLYKKRTINEVREKCKMLGFTEEYIDEIIEYLVENGYLDDEKYVMKYILEIIKLKKKSRQEIKMDLIRRGIDEQLIEKYLTEELRIFEIKCAKELAIKKYKSCKDILKVKKYLMSKGYAREAINIAVDSLNEISNNDIEMY